ncbi:MFS transporter [Actinophytocola sediminis]
MSKTEAVAVPRAFLPLVVGHSCSAYGNYLNLIALSLFSYELTGTPLGVGVVMALRLTSGFGAGLVAGALLARVDRRRVMIGTDLAQAAGMLALAVAPGQVVLLGAVAVVLGFGNTLFTVALRSGVPEMVGEHARARANGWLVSGRSIGMVLGFVSAGLVVAAGGFGVAFLVNAATFLVSAGSLLLVRLPMRSADPPTPRAGARRWLPLAGLAPVIIALLVTRGADALGSASHNTALPIHAAVVDPAGPAVVMSQFWASWAVGMLLAHQLLRRLPPPRGEWAFAVGTCLMSVCFALAFTGPPWPLFLLFAALAGLADGTTEILYVTRLQQAPDPERSRLLGFSATAETLGFAVGMLVSSSVLEVAAPVVVVASFHGFAFLVAGGLLVLLLIQRRVGSPR